MQISPESIIQWNLNGYYNNIDEIKLIINLHQPIALCLQETNFKLNESPTNLNNYDLIKKKPSRLP